MDIYLYMILVEEIPWLHFVKLNHIRKLPLNEQVSAYKQHLCDIEQIRACGGKSIEKSTTTVEPTTTSTTTTTTTSVIVEEFLQQEDLNYILQEDNFKIIIT